MNYLTGKHVDRRTLLRGVGAAIALLIPLNFLAFSFIQERGFTAPSTASRLILILLQSIFVARRR